MVALPLSACLRAGAEYWESAGLYCEISRGSDSLDRGKSTLLRVNTHSSQPLAVRSFSASTKIVGAMYEGSGAEHLYRLFPRVTFTMAVSNVG